MTRWTVISIIVLGLFLSSCTIHNLRARWTSNTCPKHSVRLKNGLVKAIPSGPYVIPMDNAIPYTMYDKLPLPSGNAKLKYQKDGCEKLNLEFAKIKYCRICSQEHRQWNKKENAKYCLDLEYERSDTARALVILGCLQFLMNEKYIDSLLLDSFYIVRNRFTDRVGIMSNKQLKDNILTLGEIKNRGLKNYMEITKFEYPPKRWKWHNILITYTVYPQGISLFNNLERKGNDWTMHFHRIVN
jgi:hypothetical protein